MIFSLIEKEKSFEIPELENIDVFCFFSSKDGVCAHESLWWEMMCSSLRGKRSVLILEPEIMSWPLYNPSARWQSGDNWCWLTPRSLRIISDAYKQQPMNFVAFKNFLELNK